MNKQEGTKSLYKCRVTAQRKLCGILLTLFALLIFLSDSAYCAGEYKKSTPLQQVHSFMMKIENGVILPKDLSAIKKLTKNKDETVAKCAVAILAQYQCEVKGDPVTALKIVVPYVLNQKDSNWS